MIIKEKIEQIVSEIITNDFFVVEIKTSAANKISVLIDSFKGATIDDCIKISRHIESNLDRDIEDFELEVSTPGLGKNFKVDKQYEKNIGKKVTINTTSGKEITGELLSFANGKIEVKEKKMIKPEGKKKKEKVEIIHNFDINDVKSTKLVISFK